MNKNLYGKEVWRVDSTVLIVDIFFELTNTVFVNSTNISTNIETAVLSMINMIKVVR